MIKYLFNQESIVNNNLDVQAPHTSTGAAHEDIINQIDHDYKYQWMVARTCYVDESEADNSKWIRMLSRGGLYLPSLKLKQLVEYMESDFQRYHGPSLSLEQNSINILAKMLRIKNPDMPLELLELFSRARFFMRLKFLNNEMLVLEKSINRRYTVHVNKFI